MVEQFSRKAINHAGSESQREKGKVTALARRICCVDFLKLNLAMKCREGIRSALGKGAAFEN